MNDFDKLLWILATICFGICALAGLARRTPAFVGKVGWMCLGFMFIALTQVV